MSISPFPEHTQKVLAGKTLRDTWKDKAGRNETVIIIHNFLLVVLIGNLNNLLSRLRYITVQDRLGENQARFVKILD
jgi:hypothetical protein